MSKKKLTSIISTVVAIALGLTAFLLTDGHIKKTKSVHDEMVAGFSEMRTLLSELMDAGRSGGMPEMLSYARSSKPRATEAANKLRAACDYFEKLRVPSSLKDELKAVRAGIPEMRSFADAFDAMFGGVMLESEFESAVADMATRAERLVAADGFAQAEADFIKELNRLNSRKHFVWLVVRE